MTLLYLASGSILQAYVKAYIPDRPDGSIAAIDEVQKMLRLAKAAGEAGQVLDFNTTVRECACQLLEPPPACPCPRQMTSAHGSDVAVYMRHSQKVLQTHNCA